MKREDYVDLVSEDVSIVNELLKLETAQHRLLASQGKTGVLHANVPPITSIDNALQIYYTYSEIGNAEIKSLFGNLSSATVSRLKKAVKTEMDKHDILSYGMYKVNTTIAFAVWGIDVSDLEKRRKKLKDLNL